MRKKSLECQKVLLIVSLLLAAFKSHAQLGIPPLVSALPEEAPASLFAGSIGDSDVELFIQGFWESSILSLGTLTFGGPAAAAFNATPFLLTQRPDLYLLLVFRRQWWLEASVADDIERATWALGYSGEEDDFLESARLGNTGIFMPDYPYIAFGAPAGAFGAVVSGRDESRGTAFDAMVRWDGLSWRSRNFSGLAETVETVVRPREQLRGRRFVLPHEGLTSIALYDHTASGKRLLQTDEYSVSLSKGFVELRAEPKGLLSVDYTYGAGLSETDVGLYRKAGLILESTIVIDNTLEARNLYALSDSPSRRELFVRNLASSQPDLRFEVREVGPGLVEVVKAGVTDPRHLPPDDYRKPFHAVADQYWLYEDDPVDDQTPVYPPTEGYAIVARSTETVDSIVLGRETVPGTITVFRDGAQSEAYEYDNTTGTLELFPPPRSGESILVRYAVTSADRSDGALVFAAGTRFPWLGLDWAVALGGRWSLPGVAYAAGGELKPAWTGLAIGMERRETDFGFGAKTLAKYARASATDLYRLAGMEDAAGFQSPFRPISGDTDNFEVDVIIDSGLATAFPDLMDKIHSSSRSNKVLSIMAKDGGGEIGLLRYIEPAPMASYGLLSFFIRTDEVVVDPGALLNLQLQGGESGGLTIEVPVDSLMMPGWHKVEVSLDPVSPEVRIITPDGQSLPQPMALPDGFIPVTTVGELRLTVSGLDSGTVFIDEIIFEEAEEGLSAILALDFSLGQAAAARPPYLRVDLTGVVDDSFSLGGSLRAGWVMGPSEWALSLAPVWSENYTSAGLGYTLAVPSRASTTRVMDQFTQDLAAGSFARTISGVLGVDELRLGLEAGASETGNRFSQNWKGSAAWGALAGVGVDLALTMPKAVASDLDPADVWLESWQLLSPVMEDAASSRRLNLNASFVASRLSVDYRQDFSAPGTVATNAGVRARLPFGIGIFGFEPFLERRYKISETATPTGFTEDFSLAISRTGLLQKPFMAIPFLDLFMDDPGNRFVESAAGSDSASYSTGAGFSARRPIGYGLTDLFVPNTLELQWTRTFEAKLDSLPEYHDFRIKATTAAVNLFGFGGVRPLIDVLAYDEYSTEIDASARYYPEDSALLPSLGMKHSVSAETRPGSTLTVASRFTWNRIRTGSQASESISFSLGKKPDRSWLGDLVGLIFKKRLIVAEPDSADTGDSSVSRWFDSIMFDSAVLRDSLDASMTISGQELPGSKALKTTIGYATRVIIPGSLSVGFHSSLNPSVSFKTEGWVWGLGYEFAIDGRVSF